MLLLLLLLMGEIKVLKVAKLGHRPLGVPISSCSPQIIKTLLKLCNCRCRDNISWERIPQSNYSVVAEIET